jgi:hypothetical protein
MTFEEAKKAILVANEHFATFGKTELTKQEIGDKVVNLIFDTKGTRWDYGIPSMYELDKIYIDDLKDWWKKIHPNTGEVLPPQYKDKSNEAYQVNLQWKGESDRLFNLHLSVTQ